MLMDTLLCRVLLVCCAFVVVNSQQSPGSCSACNCQVNNVESLRLLVETVVNRSMDARLPAAVNQSVDNRFQSVQQQVNATIDEKIEDSQRDAPVVKILYVSRGTTSLELRNISGNSGQAVGSGSTVIATISNFNPANSATNNNLLAYRPNFSDFHRSGLAGLFVNIDSIFPCVAGVNNYSPVCTLFTYEEDGFRSGRTVINAADIGNHFNVFTGGNRAAFGFAFSGCSTFDSSIDCFPLHSQYSIVCLLPRNRCG